MPRMTYRMQHNRMGYCPRDEWERARMEWIDDQVDRKSGRREMRMALRNFRRTFYVTVMRSRVFFPVFFWLVLPLHKPFLRWLDAKATAIFKMMRLSH